MFNNYTKKMKKKIFLFGWKGFFKETLNTEFPKFCMVGVLGISFNYSIFFLLFHFFNVYYIIASAAGFILAIFVSFTLNNIFTFKNNLDKKNEFLKYLLKYIIIMIVSLFAGINFLRFLVHNLDLNPYIANIATIAMTTTINFTGSKYYAFKR